MLRQTNPLSESDPRMKLAQFLTAPRIARRVARLTHEVTEQSREAVRARLGDHAMEMSLAEARGYVRARAAAVIHRVADAALADQRPLPAWARDQLVAQATDRVVQQVTLDLFRPRHALRRQAG